MKFNKKWLFLITISLLVIFSNLTFVAPAEGTFVSNPFNFSMSYLPESFRKNAGVDTDGSNFFVLNQQVGTINKYTMSGTYLEYQTISSIPNICTGNTHIGLTVDDDYIYIIGNWGTGSIGVEQIQQLHKSNYTFVKCVNATTPVSNAFALEVDDDYLYIQDFSLNAVAKYYKSNLTWTGEFVLNHTGLNNEPRGLDYDGFNFRTTEFNQLYTYKYYNNGTYHQRWTNGFPALESPFDLTSNDTHIWVVGTESNVVVVRLFEKEIVQDLDINLTSPTEGYTFETNVSLPLNFTFVNNSVDSCWFNVFNSTDDEIISNTTITNCLNTTFNLSQGAGTYDLTIYYNDTFGSIANDTVNFYVSPDAPAINLLSPTDNGWETTNNVWFNFTATDTNNVNQCQLWNNESGTWSKKFVWDNPASGVEQSTSFTITDKLEIIWNVWCNDTIGNADYFATNYSFSVDTVFPSTTIDDISTTQGSQTFSFDATSNDSNGFLCRYTIFNLVGGVDSSAFYTCNAIQSPSVSSFASYILQIETIDLAGNINATNETFSVIASSGGGGGGGSGGIVVETDTGNWTLETDTGNVKYELIMIVGTSRTKSLVFENKGTTSRAITIECQGELCDYVMLEDDDIILPLSQRVKTEVDFTIMLPRDYPLGATTFDLVAEDEDGNKGVLTTTVDVRRYSLIKLLSSLQIGNFSINYFLLFILIATGLYFVFNKVVFLKKAGSVGLSFLLSLLLSITIVMLI